MPTKNPRVNITLSPSLDLLVSKLGTLQRVSKSSVIRELLEAAEPQLLQMVAYMELASKSKHLAKATISKDMQSAVNGFVRDSEAMLSRAGNLTRDLVAEAELVQGRRPARPAGTPKAGALAGKVRRARRPPSSNRGVK